MKRMVAATMALALAGCSSTPMIRSVDRTKTGSAPAAGTAAYLGEYALPRSRFTVTLSAPSAAAPAATVPPTVNNTVTVNTAAPAAPAAAAPKDPASDLAAWCRTQREAYNQRQRTIANAANRLAALQLRFDETFVDDDIVLSAAEKADWKTRLEAQAPLMIAADEARHENLSAMSELVSTCPQPIRVTITETVERDPTRVISLYADHDEAASDRLNVALDANGFITSLTGTSTDRSGDAIVGATKTLAAFTTFVDPFSLSGDMDLVVVTANGCHTSGSALARSDRMRASIRQAGSINERVIRCALAMLAVPEGTPEIDLSLPREFTWIVPAPADGGLTATTIMEFKSVESLGLTGSIKCATGRAVRSDENLVGEGLVWSTPVPCELTVSRNAVEVARANTWSLDSSRTTLLEVPRTPLVAQTSGYTFVNGRQTGANWERPSTTEQVVTLPVRMIGAVVEGVTAGAAGQRGRTEAHTAQIEAETARIEALTALEAARAARAGEDEEDDEE